MKRLFLVLSLLLAAAPAWAQPAPTSQPAPKKTLKRLKKERDITRDAYNDSRDILELLRQERRKLLALQKAANAKLIAAEKQRPIPTRQQAVRAAKQELHRIGQQLATNQLRLEPRQTALQLLRLHCINALSAYATRLLEVAYRTRPNRPAHAAKLTREAMEDLKRRANLLRLVPPPPTPPKPPPFDRAFTTTERLVWLKARMKNQVERFSQQLKDLEPIEARQDALLKRLNRLAVQGRGGRDLTEAIRREQKKLETLKVLRRTITNFKATYLKQIKRVSDTLRDRAK